MNWNRLITDLIFFVFLHLDRLSCCCSWTFVPEEVTSVYDPTTGKRMILENGKLVEPPDNNVETSDTSSLGVTLTSVNQEMVDQADRGRP